MQNDYWANYATTSQNNALGIPQLGSGSRNPFLVEEDFSCKGMRDREWDSWTGAGVFVSDLQIDGPDGHPAQLQTAPPQPPLDDGSNEAIQPWGEPPPVLHCQFLDTQEKTQMQTTPRDTSLSQASEPRRCRTSRKRKRSSVKPQVSAAVMGLSPLTVLSDDSDDEPKGDDTSPLDSTPLSTQDKDSEMDAPPQKKRRSLRQTRRVNYAEVNGGFEEQCSTSEGRIQEETSVPDEEFESVPEDFIFRNLPGAALAYREMRRKGYTARSLLYHTGKACRFAKCKFYNYEGPGGKVVRQGKRGKPMPSKSRDSLRRHVRTHFPLKFGYVWQCLKCGEMFARPDMGSRHVKTCTREDGLSEAEVNEKIAELKSNIYLFFDNGKGYNFCGGMSKETTVAEHEHCFEKTRKKKKA